MWAETVYATYRSKPRLLGEVIRAAVTRGDEPEDPLQRGWVKRLLMLPDLERRLESFAMHTAETLRLTGPLHVVIRDAGTGAPELSELIRDLRELRYGGVGEPGAAQPAHRRPRLEREAVRGGS